MNGGSRHATDYVAIDSPIGGVWISAIRIPNGTTPLRRNLTSKLQSSFMAANAIARGGSAIFKRNFPAGT